MSIRTRTSGITFEVAPPPTTAVTPLDALIAGLAADGLTAKLDRLWIFAQATEALALVDIIAGATATAVNSPTFTVDRGYTGDGSTQYIDSNFNPTTAPSPHFVQDSACLFAWNNTAGASGNPWLAGQLGTANNQVTPRFVDNNTYWNINTASGQSFSDTSGVTGLYLANRSGSNTSLIDVNGVGADTGVEASAAPVNNTFIALGANATSLGTRECCCFGFGESLTAGDRVNIYNRLRTYMTAVGVP